MIHETLELLLDKMLQRYIIPDGHMTRDQRLKVMKGAIDRMAALRSLRRAQKVEESLFDPINNGDMFDYNTGESKVDMLLEFWDHKEGPPVTAPSIDGIGWKRIEMERRRVARETRREELSLKEAATSGAIPRVAQPIVDAQMSELTSSTDPTNSASDDERKKNRAIELYFLEGKSRKARRERGRSISLAQRGRLTFVVEAGVREAYKADIIRTRSARGVESLDAESWYAVFDKCYDLHQSWNYRVPREQAIQAVLVVRKQASHAQYKSRKATPNAFAVLTDGLRSGGKGTVAQRQKLSKSRCSF